MSTAPTSMLSLLVVLLFGDAALAQPDCTGCGCMLRKCGAHARSSARPCEAPAMRNGRCRFHGGKSTGAAHARGLGPQPAGKLEARALLAPGDRGTAERAP